MPRIITVASQKGGVGKTTTAVNLAASLCLAGHRVVLLDLDPQGNATSGVGLEPERHRSGEHYLSALLAGQPFVSSVRETRLENLWALPSSSEVADLEIVQRLLATPAERLREGIRNAMEDFDYLLIDCPPSLRGPPTVALHISDSVVIPVQCEYYAMEGLSQILPVIEDISSNDNINLNIEGLLLTMFSPQLDLSHEVVEEINTYFGKQTFRAIVPRDVTLAEAASHGQPAVQYAPTSRGSWSYIELAREVIENGQAKTG